jgi:ribosome-associated protein
VKTTTKADIEALVRLGANAAAEKKAMDVVAIYVAETLVVTDYFLIATGSNDRQVHAIADSIEDALREAGVKPRGREGERELKWVLLDYGDFVVHVFQPDERGFYRLEKLWSDAPALDLPASVANVTAAATKDDPEESDRDVQA